LRTLLSSKWANANDLAQFNSLATISELVKIAVTMRPQAISPAGAPKAVGPYSVAVRVGDFLYASGQIPLDPASGALISGEIEAQTERVLENIKVVLTDQGLSFGNVVKTTVFMTNLGEFAQMNNVYARYFSEPFPARSTVQVAALPKGAAVEIEIVAHFSTP
jgi:2-iminobutanoate/2-iminopropanoate deaminase